MRNYSIENLLLGSYYSPVSYSRKGLIGEINFAEKRDDVWVGTNATAYAIRFRPAGSIADQWATISVSHPE